MVASWIIKLDINKMLIQIIKTNILIPMENTLSPFTAYFNTSVKKVTGENKDMMNKLREAEFKGMKIPPINTKGNLIKLIIIITSEVMSEGYEEASKPNKEPTVSINPIPATTKNICMIDIIGIEKIKVNITIKKREIKKEYKNEARNIPNKS